MDNDKQYLYKELENLNNSDIFKDNVLFKLTSGDYTTYEYHQSIEPDNDDEDNNFLLITFDSCYDNILSTYDIVYNPEDDVIINYKFNSKRMYSYAKPYTKTNKYIINRETKSIGYKENNEIRNSSRELYHLIFSKNKNSKLININREFFKGETEDGEDPKLNRLINIKFEYEDDEIDDEYSPVFINGIEEYTLLDKNGNIDDHTKARTIYADTSCGEMICVHKDFDYMSSRNDNEIIIPYMGESTENTIKINYIRKADESDILATEEFYIESDGTLTPTFIKNRDGETNIERINDTYLYTKVIEHENDKYIIEATCNYPLSGNIFSYSSYKGILGFAALPYFDALYHTEVNGEIFVVKNNINKATIEKGDNIYSFIYEYDNYGIITKQLFIVHHIDNETQTSYEGERNMCKYNSKTLPNGNKFIESMILAEPVYPLNKKSIFYRAVEISKNEDGVEYISSDYRAVMITHKDYKI